MVIGVVACPVPQPKVKSVDRFNQEFRRLLTSSGWNQERAAMELMLTPATISRYKSGELTPSGTALRLFACLIGEPLTIDINGEAVTLKDQPPSMETWETLFLGKVRKLPYRKRQEVLGLFSSLIDVLVEKEGSISYSMPLKPPASAPPAPDQTPPPASVSDPSKDPTVGAFVSAIAAGSTAVALRSLGLPPTPVSPTASNAAPSSPSHPAKDATAAPPAPAPVKRVLKK